MKATQLVFALPFFIAGCGGDYSEEDLQELSKVSLEQFELCDDKGGSFYRNECKGSTGVYYAIVGRHSSDGVSMELREDCAGNGMTKDVDAQNLKYEYSKENVGRCVRVVAEIGSENFMTPDIKVERTVWVESDEELEGRKREEERISEEKRIAAEAAAEEKRRQDAMELDANKTNAEWLANKFGITAASSCQRAVEQLAKYSFEWTDGWSEMKFPGYLTRTSGDYVVVLTGDKVKFQNGFGAWQNQKYGCAYNAKTKKVVTAFIR